jgi:hypothetical protein
LLEVIGSDHLIDHHGDPDGSGMNNIDLVKALDQIRNCCDLARIDGVCCHAEIDANNPSSNSQRLR